MKHRQRVILLVGILSALWNQLGFAENPSVNLQTFHPALGSFNIISVEGTEISKLFVPSLGMWLDWSIKPLRWRDNDNQRMGDVVPHFLTWHVTGGLAVRSWLFIALDIPVGIYQNFDPGTSRNLASSDGVAPGLADIRLSGKAQVRKGGLGTLGVAIVSQFTFPTGNDQSFRGNGGVGIEPKIAVDYHFWKGAFVAGNLGILFRTFTQVVGNFTISHQLRYGLGVFVPLPQHFSVMGELNGSTSLINGPNIYSPLELAFGARFDHSTGLSFNLGFGVGLTHPVGVPQARVFFGLSYTKASEKQMALPPVVIESIKEKKPDPIPVKKPDPVPVKKPDPTPVLLPPAVVDTDSDGVLDPEDQCPNAVGPVQNRGCPLETKQLVVTKERIELKQMVRFVTGKATINQASFSLLDQVVSVLQERSKIQLRIDGYADNRGNKTLNLMLSQKRADAIRDYLVSKGISPSRLISLGQGTTRPLGDERTQLGQDKNRRVEFIILQQ